MYTHTPLAFPSTAGVTTADVGQIVSLYVQQALVEFESSRLTQIQQALSQSHDETKEKMDILMTYLEKVELKVGDQQSISVEDEDEKESSRALEKILERVGEKQVDSLSPYDRQATDCNHRESWS